MTTLIIDGALEERINAVAKSGSMDPIDVGIETIRLFIGDFHRVLMARAKPFELEPLEEDELHQQVHDIARQMRQLAEQYERLALRVDEERKTNDKNGTGEPETG